MASILATRTTEPPASPSDLSAVATSSLRAAVFKQAPGQRVAGFSYHGVRIGWNQQARVPMQVHSPDGCKPVAVPTPRSVEHDEPRICRRTGRAREVVPGQYGHARRGLKPMRQLSEQHDHDYCELRHASPARGRHPLGPVF